jgi:molecular chaperone GrpE (heat shock protein)
MKENFLFNTAEEKQIKEIVKESIKNVIKEYIKVIKKLEKNNTYHVENDVKCAFYYHLRRRFEKIEKLKQNFPEIVFCEYPSIFKEKKLKVSKRDSTKRLDFAVINPSTNKTRVIVAIEMKFPGGGYSGEELIKELNGDINKLKREWKENEKGDYYLLFFHEREYKKNLENKIQEFENSLKKLNKKKGRIKFYYIQKNLKDPKIWVV